MHGLLWLWSVVTDCGPTVLTDLSHSGHLPPVVGCNEHSLSWWRVRLQSHIAGGAAVRRENGKSPCK